MEAVPRHRELIVETLQSSKGAATAGIDDIEGNDEELDSAQAFQFMSLAARAHYLLTDKPCIVFAAKDLCRSTSKPNPRAWKRQIRLRRYLRGKPRLV